MSGTFDNTSLSYFVRRWRSVPEQAEEELENFLNWLEYDDEAAGRTDDEVKIVKALVDKYLGRNMGKVTKGERKLLKQWEAAVKAH